MVNSDTRINFIFITFFSILIIILWLPFGYRLGGLIEEWGTLGSFVQNGLFFIADSNSPLAAHFLRPLTIFPQAVAFKLDPNSFRYWHLITMVSLFLKGFCLSKLSFSWTRNLLFSLMVGTVFILYPADTMQMSFRSLHINFALALMCISLMTYQFSTDTTFGKRILLYIISVTTLFSACLMYEAALFLSPFPLLAFFIEHKFKINKQVLKQQIPLLIWLLSAAGIVVNLLINVKNKGAYQGAILSGNKTFFDIFQSAFGNIFSVGAFRIYFHSWYEAGIKFFALSNSFSSYFISIALFVGTIVFFLPRLSERQDVMKYLRIILFGFVMSILGYLPYIFSNSHYILTQRIYLFSALGGSLVLSSIAWIFFGSKKIIFTLVFIILTTLGMANQYQQFLHYLGIFNYQAHIMYNIVKLVPDIKKNKSILILDSTGKLNDVWMLKSPLLQGALTYIYGENVSVDVCAIPENKMESFLAKTNTSLFDCKEATDSWILGAASAPVKIIKKDQAHILSIGLDDIMTPVSVKISNPASEVLRNRVRGVFNCELGQDCNFFARNNREDFYFDFGGYWGLDIPIPGIGWRSIEWVRKGFSIESFSWKNETNGALIFDIVPKHEQYILNLRIYHWINEDVRNSLKLNLNNHDLALSWTDEKNVTAVFDGSILKELGNKLIFRSLLDEKEGVSFAMDWVRLVPMSNVDKGKNTDF